jgi:hypothetical protein
MFQPSVLSVSETDVTCHPDWVEKQVSILPISGPFRLPSETAVAVGGASA